MKKVQLSKIKRPTVGVAVDAMMSFGRQILRGIAQYANLKRRWLLIEDFQLDSTTARVWPECDGIIVSTSTPEILEQFQGRCRYLISCSGGADREHLHVVCMDDKAVGALAGQHLIDCKLKHFGFYGDPDFRVSANRCAGLRQVLAEQGLICIESPVVYHWTPHPYGAIRPEWASLIRWVASLPKPIGILAMDDMAARDLAGACLQGGIAVPDQVAIVGVNNDDLLCESAWPPISSVHLGVERIGYNAARMMDRLLAGEKLPRAERSMLLQPVDVIRRMSTNVMAVKDPMVVAALRYIHEHACNPCTVSDVLKHVPVNRRWLERQFAHQINRSPHDEIIHVRMQVACRLLLQPEFTLDQIATNCGFQNVGSFSRTFSQRIGETPAAYRRKRRSAGK